MTSILHLAPFSKIPILFAFCGLSLNCLALPLTQAKSGKTIEVTPTALNEEEVTFELKGTSHTLPLNSLTPESQKALREWQEANQSAASESSNLINETIGHPLFEGNNILWEQSVDTIGQRLRWRQESSNPTSISYRSYPRPNYGFLNAHPYCCTLYADQAGKASHFSLVFANKGDFGSTVGSGEDHFKPQGELPTPKDLNQAIDQDVESITNKLSEALGEADTQYYGEKEDRRKVQRWDYSEHSFILSKKDDEYAHLLIVPKTVADNEGKVKLINDRDMRSLLAANVEKRENGDTLITNIPMVNQGPKGYCAPATFERAMRYVNIPADMYLLATLATSPGGGTNSSRLADESKRIVRSKARKIRDLDLSNDLSFKTVAKYVDKGVPLLWQMSSLPPYNNIANKRTKERESVTDFTKWTTDIAAEAEEIAGTLRPNSNFHICMIVGYNEATQELAVSDSWGPGYELRWIHIDIAKQVTTRGGFVIDI